MTTLIRKVGDFEFRKGTLQADGLYMFFNVKTEECSFWYDSFEAEKVIDLPDNEFLEEARESIEHANSYKK